MKRIHADEIKQSTHIDFVPVIEGYSNDYRTIFTTPIECMRLCGDQVIVTFDLPILLKAVDIIHKVNLTIIIPILGGFHLLKSYLASVGNFMDDSGLLELIQLIYPGSTTADHILNEEFFDMAILAHLLIDAAIYQYIIKHTFNEKELGEMSIFMEEVVDGKMGARYTAPIDLFAVFEKRFEETFKKLAEGGRTPALWVLYNYMVDTIKILIRTERLADYNGNLTCIVTRLLHIFSAAGHQYAK